LGHHNRFHPKSIPIHPIALQFDVIESSYWQRPK
jgi:hypothetical protein